MSSRLPEMRESGFIRCLHLQSHSDRLLLIQLRVARKQLAVFGATKPKGAIEIILPLPSFKQAFGLEPLEVGQVAQRGEAERFQESPRRHIGEGRAGLRGAD